MVSLVLGVVHFQVGTVDGIGIAIDKGFQPGGAKIREMGYPLESLAILESIDDATGTVVFRPQP